MVGIALGALRQLTSAAGQVIGAVGHGPARRPGRTCISRFATNDIPHRPDRHDCRSDCRSVGALALPCPVFPGQAYPSALYEKSSLDCPFFFFECLRFCYKCNFSVRRRRCRLGYTDN